MEVGFPGGYTCYTVQGENHFYFWKRLSSSWQYQRYYFIEGKFYKTGMSASSSSLDPAQFGGCMNDPIYYKPELRVYFPLLSFALCVFVFITIYKLIFKRLMP